jgi:hypothetical protein
MNPKNCTKFIEEALAIESEEAKEAGALGFMAKVLVQATMPHSKVIGSEYERHNGSFRLTILASSAIGIPYGSIPRLLISWITTEAVKKQKKELILGKSLSKFMQELDLVPTGGKWGTITRLREQMKKLFSASISCSYTTTTSWAINNIQPVTRANLWWDPKKLEQESLFESNLVLGQEFFNEIVSNPIPIDMRALKALKKSPMALDIYCWLTHRLSYLKTKTSIPWECLQVQFGSDYNRVSDFKKRFLGQLKAVSIIYKEAKVEENEQCLILKPSRPHVLPLNSSLLYNLDNSVNTKSYSRINGR